MMGIYMIKVDRRLCLRCSGCVGVCPRSALKLTEHGIECDADKCIECGICVSFCPVGALSLPSRKSSVSSRRKG
jgi:ferredoxin